MNSCEVPRSRNRRGEGSKLRADIVEAAAAILAEDGREDAVTLRAVARRIGISAPSIYAHFADREAIIIAILEDAFSELIEAITGARDTQTDPVDRLRAGCGAYLRFGEERPLLYRVLFQRFRTLTDRGPDKSDGPAAGAEAFGLLVGGIQDCIDAGRSTSTNAFTDAAAVWVAMHGYSLLHAGAPGFPWPPEDDVFNRITLRAAGIPDWATTPDSRGDS